MSAWTYTVGVLLVLADVDRETTRYDRIMIGRIGHAVRLVLADKLVAPGLYVSPSQGDRVAMPKIVGQRRPHIF